MNFLRFGLDFGSPGAFKKSNKIENIEKHRFFNVFSFERGFWDDSGKAPDRFCKDFDGVLNGFERDSGQIFAAFCQDLEVQAMIRATKAISRRPNHMCGHLDAQQSAGPVGLRRLLNGFHSVAKQASF